MTDLAIRILYATIRSLSFLTRLPVGNKWFENKKEARTDAAVFPYAGGIIGFTGALALLAVTFAGFSPVAAALSATVTLVVLTGALHEDGLSDTADAFGTLKTPEERLTVMKDSRTGVYGCLALVLVTGLRVILLADITADFGLLSAFFTLIAVEAASRGVMVWFWYSLPAVRSGGSATISGEPDRPAALSAMIAASGIFALLMIPVRGFWTFIAAAVLVMLCLSVFIRLCRHKIGGYTGDTIGAMQQIATVALLAGLAMHV